MPQPLNKTKITGNIMICNGGMRSVTHNPTLALCATEAILSWSNVEFFLLKAYVQILQGSPDDAYQEYLHVKGQAAKDKALLQAAETRLSTRDSDLLSAIMEIADSARKTRNKLVHWTWGYVNDMEDAYLLIDPRHLITSSNVFEGIGSSTLVFKESDFNQAIQLNDKICSWGLKFLLIQSGHIAHEDLYQQIISDPIIQGKLAKKQRNRDAE